MRSLSAISVLPFLAAFTQPARSQIATASPYDISLEQRDCANPCGYYSQLCCTSSQTCMTNSLNQAVCSDETVSSSSGTWQYFTSTFTQTDFATVTSVYSSYVITAAATTTTTSTCAVTLGESTCGTSCCSASETCSNGVCVAGASSEEAPTGTATTGTATPAIRPTSSGAETVTTTQSPTTTVGFISPVSTNGTAVISEAHTSKGLSAGAIAGIVIGVVAGVFLFIMICACLCIRGAIDGLLALFGMKPRRRTETTYVEEHVSHHSQGEPPARRTWFGTRPSRPTRTDNNNNDNNRRSGMGWLGWFAIMAGAVALCLGLRRRRDEEEKSEYSYGPASSYYYYSDYYSGSSEQSDDRRTRVTRDSRRSQSQR